MARHETRKSGTHAESATGQAAEFDAEEFGRFASEDEGESDVTGETSSQELEHGSDADEIKRLIAEKQAELKQLKSRAKGTKSPRERTVRTPESVRAKLDKYPSGHVFATLIAEAEKLVAISDGQLELATAIADRAQYYSGIAVTMASEMPEDMLVTTHVWDWLNRHEMLASADRKRAREYKHPVPSLVGHAVEADDGDETGSDVEVELAGVE